MRVSGTPVSVLFMYAGLFSTSWDRLLAPTIAGYAFKVPILMFGLALAANVVDALSNRGERNCSPLPQGPARWFLAILLAQSLSVLWASDKQTAMLQLIAVTSTAAIPFLATYHVLLRHRHLDAALTAFIRGGVFAAVYGLYQLFAFYTGLPQGLEYTGLNGEFGRISAFNSEPGFFGYFLILVLAATGARALLRNQSVPWLLIAFLVVVLILAGSRATLIMLPLLILLFIGFRPTKRAIYLVGTGALIVVLLGLTFALARPQTTAAFWDRAATIVDPREESSNAVRLVNISVANRVIADHPYGVGPGNFYLHARQYGLVSPVAAETDLPVNNMWLQARVEGGWLVLALQAFFAASMVRRYFVRRRGSTAWALMAGWLAVMAPASLITSYFYSNQLWVVLALAVASHDAQAAFVKPRSAARGIGSVNQTHMKKAAGYRIRV